MAEKNIAGKSIATLAKKLSNVDTSLRDVTAAYVVLANAARLRLGKSFAKINGNVASHRICGQHLNEANIGEILSMLADAGNVGFHVTANKVDAKVDTDAKVDADAVADAKVDADAVA